MTDRGRAGAKDFRENFPILFLTKFHKGLCSFLSGLDERGERDRHVRGAGCGGRQGWGVARCPEDVRLRAGRTLARPATGSETAHLRMDRRWETHDGMTPSAAYGQRALLRPIALGGTGQDGSTTPAARASRTPRAERRALQCSIIPKVLMSTLADYRIGIRHQGCIGHPAFRTPSSQEGEVGMLTTRARQRRGNAITRVQERMGLFDRLNARLMPPSPLRRCAAWGREKSASKSCAHTLRPFSCSWKSFCSCASRSFFSGHSPASA